MTQLLVSVRSASEAEAALRGGAALIDVKEPKRGSLGRASDAVIADVVRVVAGRRPVSAALGELTDTDIDELPPSELPLAYVKWGLAGYRREEYTWAPELTIAMRWMGGHLPDCRVVAVAYADWRRAGAPKPQKVCSFAVEHMVGAFLIDTWQKDGSTLLDWMSLRDIEYLRERCSAAGVPLALAGSLGLAEIRTLLPLRPDWFAIRGAVCRHRQRVGAIDEAAVCQLAGVVNGL